MGNFYLGNHVSTVDDRTSGDMPSLIQIDWRLSVCVIIVRMASAYRSKVGFSLQW